MTARRVLRAAGVCLSLQPEPARCKRRSQGTNRSQEWVHSLVNWR
jgi:hypothetical protein